MENSAAVRAAVGFPVEERAAESEAARVAAPRAAAANPAAEGRGVASTAVLKVVHAAGSRAAAEEAYSDCVTCTVLAWDQPI